MKISRKISCIKLFSLFQFDNLTLITFTMDELQFLGDMPRKKNEL